MARPKVLLVEDNQRICTQLRSLLESMQWEVCTATTGIEGVLTFNRELPQLVVVEQFLPLLSGEELILRLRKQLSPAQLPIIVLTSSRFGALSAQMRAQVNAICQKPLHAQQFQEAIQQTYQATQATIRPQPLSGSHDPEQFYLAWGDLLQTSLPTLLFQLKQQQHSGILTLTLPQGERRFAFRQGELVYAEALIPEEQLIHFLHKRLAHRLEESVLEKSVAGTGARAALQREAILRAQLVPEKELNHLYHLYIENVIIRSLFLTQGPYQFIDDHAYVQRTAAMPINVLLLLFEGVCRYYTPQKLLQVISPYHLYRCKISPLYSNQISALIPRFQNISFAPQRLAGRTVHELLREFAPNPQLSAQLLQTLSLARLILFEGPDGTTGHPRVSESMEGPVLSEGALSPLGGHFEYAPTAGAVHTPHPHYSGSSMANPAYPSTSQTSSLPIPNPERMLAYGTPGTPVSMGGVHPPTELIPSVVMQQMMRTATHNSSPTNRTATGQHQVGLHAHAARPNNNPTVVMSRSAENPLMLDREAHLGALAGEAPVQPAISAPPVPVVRGGQTNRHSSLDNTYILSPAAQLSSPSPSSPSLHTNPVYSPTASTVALPLTIGPSSTPTNHPAVPVSSASLASSPSRRSTTPEMGGNPSTPVVPVSPVAAYSPVAPVSSPMPYAPIVPVSPVVPYAPVVAYSPVVAVETGNRTGRNPSPYQIHTGTTQAGSNFGANETTTAPPSTERSWLTQLDVDFLRVQSDNYFLALEVAEGATNEEIQAAYRRLFQNYHPERIHKTHDPDVRAKAGEILRRISQAYNVLTDPYARQQWEPILAQKKSQVGNRLLFAQEQFRQGEICLQQRRFQEAAAFYRKAMEENPKEPVYFLRLGWSIYCQESLDPLQRLIARTYIERALQMNPIFEDAYLYLGMIRKQEGFLEEAASLFQRILLLNPGHAEAYRLLSEVSQRR